MGTLTNPWDKGVPLSVILHGGWSREPPKPLVLGFGLWDQAEARHAGQAPMKKVRSREDWARLRSILWGRYAGHREVRKNWHERNGLDEITARWVPADDAEPWKPMKEIFVTSGKKLVMPDA